MEHATELTDDHDVVIDRGAFASGRKRPPSNFESNTPVSAGEDIPWKCWRLAIGTGALRLPAGDESNSNLATLGFKPHLFMLPTVQAIEAFNESAEKTNASLHVTC